MATTGTFTAVGQTATLTVSSAGDLVRIWVDRGAEIGIKVDAEGAGTDFGDADVSREFLPYATSNTKAGDIFKIECLKLPQGNPSVNYRID